jgi:hypothetical protein
LEDLVFAVQSSPTTNTITLQQTDNPMVKQKAQEIPTGEGLGAINHVGLLVDEINPAIVLRSSQNCITT